MESVYIFSIVCGSLFLIFGAIRLRISCKNGEKDETLPLTN